MKYTEEQAYESICPVREEKENIKHKLNRFVEDKDKGWWGAFLFVVSYLLFNVAYIIYHCTN